MQILPLNIVEVLGLVFLTWHYALRCGFVSDDHAVVEARKDIIPDAEKNPKKESYWVKVFNDGIVMYYLNRVLWAVGGRRLPILWHALCLGLHLGNTYLLYLVLTPLLGQETAVIAVFIWAINPMLNQNTAWISGRPYLIATMFALICMLNWQQPLIVVPLYILAVITNISIALIPVLMKVIYKTGWQLDAYIIFMLACGVPFILWKFQKRFTAALVIDRENFKFKKRRFNTLARIFVYYLWTILVPVRMGWYHQAGFRYNNKWEKFNIWTLIGYLFVGLLAMSGWPGWWFIFGLVPNANLFATNSFLQDRYIYFASIGLAIMFAPLLVANPDFILIVATFYMVRSYMYSRHLQNDELLYRENWRNHPQSDYAVNNLAFFLIQQHRYDEARVVIHRGLAINQANKMLWYNLGVTWAATGNLKTDDGKFRFLRAVDCWKMALQVEPRWKKPADDLKKMIKFLLENKVITTDKAQGSDVSIDVPVDMKGVIDGQENNKGKDNSNETKAAAGSGKADS